MNPNILIDKIKSHPEFRKAGMILCHNGVVRESSRDHREVSGLKIQVNHQKLDQVLQECRNKPGIIDVQVEIAENKDLAIGDDVMLLVIAGDIRENVLTAMSDTLDQIKTTVTKKTEFFR